MLVLARKLQEKIVIGDDIVIQVLRKSRDVVKLGIEAPASIPVHRQEIYNEIQRSNNAALRRKGDKSSPLPLHKLSAFSKSVPALAKELPGLVQPKT
jgi:carbon storage regulator